MLQRVYAYGILNPTTISHPFLLSSIRACMLSCLQLGSLLLSCLATCSLAQKIIQKKDIAKSKKNVYFRQSNLKNINN